jgi:predicted MFS family arabinose efflux permease
VLGFLALGVVLLAAFVVVERRHRHPLVPLRLFRSRSITGANLIMVVIGSVMFTLFFFLSQFLQDVRGYSPLKTGIAFLPMPIAIIIGTQISSRLVSRVGPRVLLAVGPLIATGGMILLARLNESSGYLDVLPAALVTFGIGMSFVPITLAATTGVAPRDAGLASGVINTTRQIGGSLGLAALLTVAADRARALQGEGALAAQAGGYARAYAVCAALLLLAVVVALVVLPRLRRDEPVVETEPADVQTHLAEGAVPAEAN